MLKSSKKAPRAASAIRNTSLAAFSVICVLALSTQASEARSHKKSWREANASIGTNVSTGSGRTFSGKASYYGNESGSRTASGQRFNQNAMTAAHRSLPFGTRLKVTHGGRSVVVTINDRGPFIRGRVLDLSKGAARAIGLTGRGVGQVVAEVQ
jgi:rare lipoprotein A